MEQRRRSAKKSRVFTARLNLDLIKIYNFTNLKIIYLIESKLDSIKAHAKLDSIESSLNYNLLNSLL